MARDGGIHRPKESREREAELPPDLGADLFKNKEEVDRFFQDLGDAPSSPVIRRAVDAWIGKHVGREAVPDADAPFGERLEVFSAELLARMLRRIDAGPDTPDKRALQLFEEGTPGFLAALRAGTIDREALMHCATALKMQAPLAGLAFRELERTLGDNNKEAVGDMQDVLREIVLERARRQREALELPEE